MMPAALASMPDAARVWLFVLDGPAADALPAVQAWLPTWASHGRPVVASADVLNERVLAVGAAISPEEVNAGVSGCGVDAMQHAVEAAVETAGRTLVSPLVVTWCDEAGDWHTTSRPDFRRLARDGQVGPATRVVDATVTTVGELRAHGAVRPAADAWTARAFGLAAV